MIADTPTATSKDSVSLAEAAQRLGVHYMTAYRYVRLGTLAAEQVDGRWVVAAADLDELQARRGRGRRRDASRSRHTAAGSGGRDRRVALLATRLIAGDQAGSWRLVQDAIAAGRPPTDVYASLLAPALHEIGRRWAAGTVTVAEEHVASVVAMRIIAQVGTGAPRRGRTSGTVLLSAAPGDRHSLPTAMLADVLRSQGLRAIDLGADTPPDDVAQAAATQDRLVAVGICATTPLTPATRAALEQAIALVHARAGCPVVLGGAAVTDLSAAALLGADHWSRDAHHAAELFTSLATGPEAVRRGTTMGGTS